MKISEKQLQQVDKQIQRLLQVNNFYGQKLREAGIKGVSSVEEFQQLPFSQKQDLRDAYPLGLMAVPEEEVVRIHSSSGTTGTPVIIPYTAKDVDDWAEMFKRCYEFAGITNRDRIQITPGYGLWTAGIGFQNGAEKLGAMVVPMGPGNTNKQIQMMMDMKSTVITATSSYALLLAEEIEKRGIKDKVHLKKGVIGSERWGKKIRDRISSELGIELYDIYGLVVQGRSIILGIIFGAHVMQHQQRVHEFLVTGGIPAVLVDLVTENLGTVNEQVLVCRRRAERNGLPPERGSLLDVVLLHKLGIVREVFDALRTVSAELALGEGRNCENERQKNNCCFFHFYNLL